MFLTLIQALTVGLIGTRKRVAVFRQVGAAAWVREGLNISINTPER